MSHNPSLGPVSGVYADSGAVDRVCDGCGAEPGSLCTNPRTGQVSHLPCITRMRPQTRPGGPQSDQNPQSAVPYA